MSGIRTWPAGRSTCTATAMTTTGEGTPTRASRSVPSAWRTSSSVPASAIWRSASTTSRASRTISPSCSSRSRPSRPSFRSSRRSFSKPSRCFPASARATARSRSRSAASKGDNLKLQDQLGGLSAHNNELRERSKEQEAALAAIRRDLREKEAHAADLERQIRGETERAHALVEENAALRKEAQANDLVVARHERELADARQAIEMFEHETRTLRAATGEQANRLAMIGSAHDERESELSAARQHLGELETKLKAEQSLRHRLEALGESERATARNNIANLEMKVQGLTSRLGVTEKLLNSIRDQLREKTEELKSAERTVREALISKNNIERRFETLQAEVAQVTAVAENAQRARTEFADRCESVTKALESKIAALEEAAAREVGARDRARGARDGAPLAGRDPPRIPQDQEDAPGVERWRGFRGRQRRAAPEHRQARRGLKRAAPATGSGAPRPSRHRSPADRRSAPLQSRSEAAAAVLSEPPSGFDACARGAAASPAVPR